MQRRPQVVEVGVRVDVGLEANGTTENSRIEYLICYLRVRPVSFFGGRRICEFSMIQLLDRTSE